MMITIVVVIIIIIIIIIKMTFQCMFIYHVHIMYGCVYICMYVGRQD